MRVHKDFRPLLKAAKRAGWDVTQTQGGHIQVVNLAGDVTHLPSTPSDHRSYMNARQELRKMGLRV